MTEFLSCMMGILMMTGTPPQAKPPLELPIGWKEFVETGKFPVELTLLPEKSGRGVFMAGLGKLRPSYRLRFENNSPRLTFFSPLQQKLSPDSLEYGPGGFTFSPSNGDVIPIFDELYAVQVHQPGITLTRVTQGIPQPLRPTAGSRILSLADFEPLLFWEQDVTVPNRLVFDQVTITNLTDESVNLSLLPFYRDRGKSPPPDRKPLDVKLFNNELSVVRGISLRAKIVPPQVVAPHGKLVGWIELRSEERTVNENE